MDLCLGIQPWTSIREVGEFILPFTTGPLQYVKEETKEGHLPLT